MREKKVINIEIGERIKEARENVKLTQEQLAERVNVSPQYVSDLERGVVGVSVPTLKRICSSLGVSSDLILFGYSEDDFVQRTGRYRMLSQKQIVLLNEIVEKYIDAIMIERE